MSTDVNVKLDALAGVDPNALPLQVTTCTWSSAPATAWPTPSTG